jgi:hypothetical protein
MSRKTVPYLVLISLGIFVAPFLGASKSPAAAKLTPKQVNTTSAAHKEKPILPQAVEGGTVAHRWRVPVRFHVEEHT